MITLSKSMVERMLDIFNQYPSLTNGYVAVEDTVTGVIVHPLDATSKTGISATSYKLDDDPAEMLFSDIQDTLEIILKDQEDIDNTSVDDLRLIRELLVEDLDILFKNKDQFYTAQICKDPDVEDAMAILVSVHDEVLFDDEESKSFVFSLKGSK